MKSIFPRLIGDIRAVIQAASPTHSDLRDRLVAAVSLTVVVDVFATLLLYLFEKDHGSTEIHNLWDAFYFTTSQLVTISTSMANPVTPAGQALCIVIDVYAITVVSTVAGMFGAFFYHRSHERRDAVRKSGGS
ncbi:Ion channel [Paracoccus saliphilus]|nr:Ion channel [Paracoccus saliphilus]